MIIFMDLSRYSEQVGYFSKYVYFIIIYKYFIMFFCIILIDIVFNFYEIM